MKNRNRALDIARAICALEIIAFWHALNYIDMNSEFLLKYGANLTMFCLAVFTFLSGFFLSKYKIESPKDICVFYSKRLLRFFPLFFVSCFSLYIGGEIVGHSWFSSIGQFVYTLIGLGAFYPPMAGTVWYISMLMFFYIITPIILYYKFNKWIISILFLILFIVVGTVIPVDNRLITYFPFYLLGLCVDKKYFAKLDLFFSTSSIKKRIQMLMLGIVILILCIISTTFFDDILIMLLIFLGGVSIIVISYGISYIYRTRYDIFSLIAYSSMVAYLFHRQIFECFRMISPNHIIPLWLMSLAIVCVFALSYYIQKLYDLICAHYYK